MTCLRKFLNAGSPSGSEDQSRQLDGEDLLEQVIASYESQMQPYANAAVSLSRTLPDGAACGTSLGIVILRLLSRMPQTVPFVMRKNDRKRCYASRMNIQQRCSLLLVGTRKLDVHRVVSLLGKYKVD